MAPIIPEVLGLGVYANLGDTRKLFMPWLNPRNGRNSVFTSSWLSRLFGRRKRRSLNNNSEWLDKELVKGKINHFNLPTNS
jgi:hypothetical protein